MKEPKAIQNHCYLLALAAQNSSGEEFIAPDSFDITLGNHIPDNFVLCRDKSNKVTAYYGQMNWDFKPYRLAASGNCKMNFDKLIKTSQPDKVLELVNEVKQIMFVLIYHVRSGVNGSLSVSSLMKYYYTTMKAAQFCIDSGENRMLGRLCLSELFSNPFYLAAYVKTVDNKRRKQVIHALLNHLNIVGQERLGYVVINDPHMHEQLDHKQHPLIPTRIYLEIINFLTERAEFLKAKTKGLEAFIKEFSDPFYGLNKKEQRKQQREQGIENPVVRPTIKEAIVAHGLGDLFSHADYKINGRAKLNGALTRMQYEMKSLIHLYTGMRNDEVNRLNYDCVINRPLEDSIKDHLGNVLIPARSVELLSTTTKFTGYQEEDSWLAHAVALDAISVLRRIVRGYALMVGVEADECPLLVSTTAIFRKSELGNKRLEISTHKKETAKTFLNKPQFKITEDDYDVLQASDPNRDFSLEPTYQCGCAWPLTTHQFRRSLAFYAVNSGFVSLPTLMRQFKHLSQEMSKYYSRNNENVKTIFGHYDVTKGKYVLPLNHIAYEVQVGMSLATAEALLTDLLDEDVSLHGKTGAYIERERIKLRNSEVLVEEFKEETAQRVHNGEVSYRKTLLGGCTNMETCECSILGEFADCLSSKCAVITSSNIEKLIASTQRELQCYEPNSIEFLSTESELEDLLRYKKYSIEREHLSPEGD